ncbi:MAG: YdcF family protein [Oscillospiraceae bacterium]|nr:YdcF family protein [Oscillospiraceae bacterium]
MKKNRLWAAVSALLVALGLFLRFALRGYAYWGYALIFAACLITAHHFLPTLLWRILLGLTCVGLVYFCIVEVPIIRNARTDRDAERPYLIVLGAAVYGEQPSLTLVRRLEGALDYLDRYPGSVAIVSGGMGKGESIPEAQAMHRWLLSRGIPEERVLLEERATSTQENLDYSFDIIRGRGDDPDGNVAIVSSAYHLYRSKSLARLRGVEAAGVAAPWGYPMVMLNYFIREAFGITHLWVFGR